MGSPPLVSKTKGTYVVTQCDMNSKIIFVFCICIIGLSLASPLPWLQGPDFSELAVKENDENPLMADESDPHIFYNLKFPMTCGELCFNGSGCGPCEEEAAE